MDNFSVSLNGLVYSNQHNYLLKIIIQDRKLLEYIGNEKGVVIPEEVETIGMGAFAESSVETVKMES